MEGGNVLHHVERESGELSGKGEYLRWGICPGGKCPDPVVSYGILE